MFYGIYVGNVVGKVTRECSCCVANVGIRCYVIDNEFYMFLSFGGFHVSVYNVGYYLLVYFIVFMPFILVV